MRRRLCAPCANAKKLVGATAPTVEQGFVRALAPGVVVHV